MYLFKGGILRLFVLMMRTFVLPTISGELAGDSRGGATDPGGQLISMLTHPLDTVRVYFDNIVGTLGDKFMGLSSLGDFAYLGVIDNYNITLLIVGILLFTLFTDTDGVEQISGRVPTKRQKIFLFVLVVFVTLMIWTALYLAYNPVGRTIIDGVQGRYFIPLIFPLFLVVHTSLIKCNIKVATYNAIVLFVPTLILTCSIYEMILTRTAV